MSANMKVYQIYYKPEQLPALEKGFVPLDNTTNPHPQFQEWYLWDQQYQQCCDEGLDYWGFVSWKFRDKSNLSSEQFLDWVTANPGYDVYLLNPAIANEAVFANGWEQGDMWHPGLSDIANDFLTHAGYKDPDVRSILLDRRRMGFATYFVANRKFWDGYIDLSRKIFGLAETDPGFNQRVFAEGGSGYNLNKSLSNFPFLNERLVGTYMDLHELNVLPYQHTDTTLHAKYQPYIDEIRALSDLKVAINDYNNDSLYNVWVTYRNSLLQRHPEILQLE